MFSCFPFIIFVSFVAVDVDNTFILFVASTPLNPPITLFDPRFAPCNVILLAIFARYKFGSIDDGGLVPIGSDK